MSANFPWQAAIDGTSLTQLGQLYLDTNPSNDPIRLIFNMWYNHQNDMQSGRVQCIMQVEGTNDSLPKSRFLFFDTITSSYMDIDWYGFFENSLPPSYDAYDPYSVPDNGIPPETLNMFTKYYSFTAPIIMVSGDNPLTISAGQTYNENDYSGDSYSYAYAYDKNKNLLPIETTSNVNTSSLGTYTITYSATYVDYTFGNASTRGATATRTVNVVDTTGPVITIIGDISVTIGKGETYTDQGATAYDAIDGNVTASIQTTSNVNTSSVGTYTVMYSATDSAGNVSNILRIINVVDTTGPVITITGDNPVTIGEGQTYTDQGATAYDALDGNVTSSIQTTSNVNTSSIGTYTVIYSVTDSAGNTSTESRTINVLDTTAPVITITGDNPVTIGEGQTYTDQGAAAYDDVDGNVTASIQTTSNVNTSSVGTYTVTYSVTDSAGNTSPKTRTVNVVDTTGPVITITGDNPVTIGEGQTYTDQGAAAYDSLDGNVTASIQTTSNVNTSSVGTYTVIYSVTDSAGNTSTKTRTVNVDIIQTIVFNSSIAYIKRDDLATLINSFDEVSSLKEVYNMWYNNTQIINGTDCWIYYAYSTVNNEVLYSSRKIKFLSKNDGTYEWIDNETIVNATEISNGLSAEDLTDYTSFYSGLEPFKMNLSSSSINIVNTVLNNSGYSLYNYIQIFNIWYNETNSFDMNYDNTTREIDVWVYVLTDQTAMEDILDKHATPIEPITDFDEKQITIEMLKPYLLEGGNVQPIFETRKLKYTVNNNNASYTWTMYTNETIESTINDTGYSTISSIDNYKLSYFYFDSYTIVRKSSKEALRSLYLAYYNSTQKLKQINEVWYNKLNINSSDTNDSEGPLITVLGQNPINIIQSTVSSYREIGVVAIDNTDSDVTDKITVTYTNKATNITESTIDTSIVQEYIVTYTVQDNAGNISTATRDLNIVADTVGPVLTILGDNPTQIELGTIDTYVDGGASAIDSIDGNITDQIIITNLNTVDLTTYGTYTITYTIEDSTGNIVTKDRIVSVVEKIDSVAPVISLNGNRINYIIVNSVASYTDEGATATDDTDGTVTVTTSGTVTTTEVGTYVVTYTATDSVGNSTTENRTIYVIEEPVAADSEPPTITLNGDSILDIYRHEASPLPDEGATAVDSYGNSLTVETTVHPNTYALGTSIIAYTARDSNDNIGFASREINVLPQYIPSTFELVGLTDSLFFQMIKADNYYRLIFNTTIDYQPLFNNYYPYPYNQIASQQIEFICMSNNSVKFKYRSTMINSGTIVYTNFENGSGQLGFTLTGVPQITNSGGTGYDLQNWANNQGTSFESVGFNSSNSRWFLNMHILSSNVPVETFGIGWMKMPTTNNFAHVRFKTEHGFPANGISNGTIRFNIYLMNFMYFLFLKRNSAGNNYILFNIYLNTNNHPHIGNDSNVEWNEDTNGNRYAYLYNVPFGLNEVEIEWNSTTQNYFINRQTNPTPVLTTSFAIGSESPTSLGLWYVDEALLRPFEPNDLKTNQQDMYYGNFYIKDNDTGNDHQIDFNDYHNVTEQQFFESKGIEPIAVGARMENVVIITTTRPVITLNGDPIINLYVGDTYTEQGASATLNNSPINTGGVTSSGTVNTSTAGVYQIVYTARKYNSSLQEYYEDKAVRIVNVKIVDTESPIINIAGSNPTELILGSTYVDEGATATDNIDGTVSVVTSGDTITETSEEGEYRITYTATDNAGNVNTATRIVIIVSTRYLYSCFSMSTNASVVNNNGNKYVFNGDTSYTADKKYGLAVGTYTIKNIPAEHPMALLNQGKLHLITYTGDDAKKSSKSVTSTTADGTYDFYHGDITVTVLGNFLTLSIYCYYHGYMGGEKLLVYKEACEIGLPESLNIKYTLGLYKSSNASVVNNNGNKYLFNGHTTYSSKYQYGLGTGTYTITNIPEQHPMAILNAGKTLQISYSGDSTKKSSKEVTSTTADGTYDFYHGDITIMVNTNFDKVSVYCYNHGYMGGENLLVYSSDCKIQMPLIDSSSLSVAETSIITSDIGMKIYAKKRDYDENGNTIHTEIYNELDVKYNKNTRKWNTLMNIDMLSNVGSGLEDGLSSNNYFQIYHNIDYNIVQKIPELISKYNETYGEEIGIDKFYESDEIDNAHILDCYMKFYLLSNPISELYTSLEYNRVINGWKVKNPTEVYNRVKASNTVKYSVFRLTHLNSKGDDLKEKYNIVYPLHSIIKIYKLWYNSSSAGDEIVDGIMFYSYKEKDDVLVKTQFATVNILYTVMTDTFSVMSETPTIRSYDYNGEDL